MLIVQHDIINHHTMSILIFTYMYHISSLKTIESTQPLF